MSRKKHLIVLNKSDLSEQEEENKMICILPEQSPYLLVSALKGDGLEALKDWIKINMLDFAQSPLMLQRHIQLARAAAEALNNASIAIDAGEPLDLVAVEIHEALYIMGDITGDRVTEELLNKVFSKFCVGK